MRSGLGYDIDGLDVIANSTTFTTLHLAYGEGSGEYPSTYNLQGQTRIQNSGSPFPRYFLDVGSDSTNDYQLLFGPPWYLPSQGTAQRPQNGELVALEVAPFGYGTPPMLVVRMINGQYWRDWTEGHGGAIGAFQQAAGYDDSMLTRVEATGLVELVTNPAPPDDSVAYRFHWNNDSLVLLLDFGAWIYSPPSGDAHRPTNSQQIHFVGGLYSTGPARPLRAIVYEIGTAVWRVPGDTTGFGRISDDVPHGEPTLPRTFITLEDFPNPFNAQTTIVWTVDRTIIGSVDIVDVLGRRVSLIGDGLWSAGDHTASWRCEDCPSGLYIMRLLTKGRATLHSMYLIR
jgi:hypothetical protein